jgi:type IV pilus assembly protein PilE
MKKVIFNDEGFSLTELLVVIVVIGILILLALPKFSAVVSRAKETEAKIMLKHLHTLEQSYFYENDSYTNEPVKLGFEQEALVTDGGNARYLIEIKKANTYEFTATATAVVDFDKDGTYNVWTVTENGKPTQTVPD